MRNIRILFTGVGRRVELLQQFKQAALSLNVNLVIIGADMSVTAPALCYCDIIRKVCGMKEESYIDELLELCKNDNVDVVIPTIDTDLLALAENKDRFEKLGTQVLISDPDKIAICRDKNFTSDFFESCGLKAPTTFNDYNLYNGKYPCFIKPKDGSSSINAYKVHNSKELKLYSEQIKEYVIQEFIEGVEYTVDVFCDFDGVPIYIVPRIRQSVRAGEVLKTQIQLDDIIIEEIKKLVSKYNPCGPITVQLIREKTTGIDYYIEINPRFGGGAPLSMKAGAKSAEALLKIILGEKISYCSNVCNNLAVYSRFDQSVCISRGDDKRIIKGIIFDLDDTLYSEKEYVKSGYRKIASFLNETVDVYSALCNYFEKGLPAIDCVLEDIGRLDLKDRCVEIYREHIPDIKLYEGVADLIGKIKKNGIKVGIITDGRENGQENKIKALGLDALVDDIIITDKLGGEQFRKPNDISFRIIQNRWKVPFEELVYIGDNLGKDFIAPIQLGMVSVWYRNKDGLYTNKTNMMLEKQIRVIDNINEIDNFF